MSHLLLILYHTTTYHAIPYLKESRAFIIVCQEIISDFNFFPFEKWVIQSVALHSISFSRTEVWERTEHKPCLLALP